MINVRRMKACGFAHSSLVLAVAQQVSLNRTKADDPAACIGPALESNANFATWLVLFMVIELVMILFMIIAYILWGAWLNPSGAW